MADDKFIEVAVALPLDATYTYKLPDALGDIALPGARVLVPFGNRKVTGYILGPAKEPIGIEAKEIIEILDDRPAFPPSLLDDLRWMADYYLAPIGETLKGALPAGINVESASALVITAKGEVALRNAATNSTDRDILARIAGDPGVQQKKLIAAFGKVNARSAINRLVRDGFLISESAVSKAKSTARVQTMARISPKLGRSLDEAIAGLKRAPARARLLQYVDSVGEAPLPELVKRFRNAGSLVKALVKDGFLATRKTRVWRDPTLGDVPEYEDKPPTLTADQRAALQEISDAIKERSFAPFLLHGVTGSGKTEVYLRAIAQTLQSGRQALVLVPEIALTPQLVGRFRARFGAGVAVLHSGMGRGERLDEWTRVREGRVRVAIGARSAVFAPFDKLGLIVVDEEHDGGYKQDEKITYNARDFGIVRARTMNAVIILGSATPSLESRHNADSNKYKLLSLPTRVESRPLPKVEIIDLRTAQKGRSEFISQPLEEAIVANFERKRQTILFLNRRGYAPFILCLKCGHMFRCPSCSVSLTYHQNQRKMMCHFCDHQESPPNLCPECGAPHIKMIGVGTERIDEEVQRILPAARIGRLDRDTVARKGELARILGALRDGSLDILIGTQMVAKGHDYPGVTLVGVLMAETSLNFPDFRAAEVTFSLLTQVAGRAGRGGDAGKVLVQTYNPEHYAIRRALEHDYTGFAGEELKNRRELDYPPFKRLVVLRISGPGPMSTRKAAVAAGEAARQCKGVRVMGPAPAPWSRVKNMYRWQVLIKSSSPKAARDAAKYVIASTEEIMKSEKSKISADVDPLRLL